MSEQKKRSPILHTRTNFRRATWQEALKRGLVITLAIIVYRLVLAWAQDDFSDFASHLVVSVIVGSGAVILAMLFPSIYEELI
ncbi:MAG: hypothetical protein AAF251_16305 [Pseudomonadota bacterium]